MSNHSSGHRGKAMCKCMQFRYIEQRIPYLFSSNQKENMLVKTTKKKKKGNIP